MKSRFRVGVDVGGTFTDAVLISEETGETRTAKVPSTPSDPAVGFVNAVDRILKDRLEPDQVSYLVHGTTVATNSLIEGKTPRTAFVTTAGLPRHAGDRPPGPALPLRHPFREAPSAGSPRPLFRGARTPGRRG